MEMAAKLKREISRQFSTGSIKRKSGRMSFGRQSSLDPQGQNKRFSSFGRQSSLDPIRRNPAPAGTACVPQNLDATMQLLFMACRGDVAGVESLLDDGIDANSIDLDGRTALHIAACEGQVEVVKLLLNRKANIDAHDRWGSTAAADAKYYGNVEVYSILKAHGGRVPKSRKTPMSVAHQKEVPEYELNPFEIQVHKSDGIAKGAYQVAKWNGTKVAVKILDKDSQANPDCINTFKYELTALEKVRHPNVIQFVGAVTQNVPMMIVIEYHPKGDLGLYLQKKGRLSPSRALRFALDIARGMNYLHECKPDPIVHCNLMPKNILLDSGGQLKVAGFGLLGMSTVSSGKFKLEQPPSIISGAACLYMAPELHNDEIYDKTVDSYSFAVILYEMIEGVRPFYPKPPEEVLKMMHEGKRPPFKKVKHYPPDLKRGGGRTPSSFAGCKAVSLSGGHTLFQDTELCIVQLKKHFRVSKTIDSRGTYKHEFDEDHKLRVICFCFGEIFGEGLIKDSKGISGDAALRIDGRKTVDGIVSSWIFF